MKKTSCGSGCRMSFIAQKCVHSQTKPEFASNFDHSQMKLRVVSKWEGFFRISFRIAVSQSSQFILNGMHDFVVIIVHPDINAIRFRLKARSMNPVLLKQRIYRFLQFVKMCPRILHRMKITSCADIFSEKSTFASFSTAMCSFLAFSV